ncbi:MAG TPA: GNAT family N-acetyltransferase [Bauldia sp.]|nr:GNAT family N-acetyltransferase [Bauldia sp.]
MSDIAIAPLSLADAHELAPLVAAYAQDRKRGAPREPDEFYAELLLKDRTAELLGARLDGRLVAFAVFFDLLDTIAGMRRGQLDDLFVVQDARGRRIGHALVGALVEEGRKRGWTEIRWMAPQKPPTARRLAEAMAKRAPIEAFTIAVGRA